MSIHTILSQEIKELDKLLIRKVTKEGWKINSATIEEWFMTFATRIVEEVGKEATQQVKLFIKDQIDHEVSKEHTLELMPSLLEHIFDNLNKK